MNSNGTPIQNNFGIDLQRGAPNRYRNNPRRGRGRSSLDKSSQSRNYKDRKPNNWREGAPRSQNDNDIIDINDSSQWPSVQESSMGSCRQSRNSAAVKIERPAERPQEAIQSSRDNFYESQPNTDVTSRRSSLSYRGNITSSNVYGFQSRDHANRYSLPPNRSRTQRYNYGQPRTYTGGNFGRRNYRNNFPQMHHMYSSEPNNIPNIMNGQIVFPGYHSFPFVNAAKSLEIDPIKQVEYYFSVHNLETDYYIRSQMDKQGWVDLMVVFKFKRIQYLEMTFEDFVNKIMTSNVLEIDLERNKIRTAIEPLKWCSLPTDKVRSEIPQSEVSPTSFSVPVTSVPPMSSEQYTMNSSYNGYVQNNAFGSFPPVFISLPGYPGNNQRGGRYMSQYGMYPNSYYNMAYNEIPSEAGYSYYMQEYYNSYPYASQAYYSGYNQRYEGYNETIDEFVSPHGDQQQNENFPQKKVNNEDLEEIAQKVSELDVSKP